MWPLLIDMTKDESIQSLRNLELEAYSHLVSALRAQGPLNSDKRKLLRETSNVLNISQERHKAEIRRALTDEKLTTIAYHVNAQNEYNNDWAQEGRRVIPLMPRMAPQTAFSAIADEVAENTDQINKQLPLPANTERKRSMIVQSNQNMLSESNKNNLYRVNEQPKHEDMRKRKFSENSSLAQHLLGPSNKMSKIQQIYRQKTKSKSKEQFAKVKIEQDQQEAVQSKIQQPIITQKPQMVKMPLNSNINTPSANGSKINILQNINLQQPNQLISKDQIDLVQDVNNSNLTKFNETNHVTSPTFNMNENINNRLKFLTKSNNIMFKSVNSPAATNISKDFHKTLKVCPSRKPITNTVPTTNQKLIVVSNAQTLPNSSILQRTLTIPFVKNISVKNFDKFKIVSTSGTPTTLASTTANSNSFNSVKHKVVTVRTSNPVNAGKKILPITQLQMLNKGSIKVLPLGGKIVGKTTTAGIPSSMYIMSNMQNLTKTINTLPIATATKIIENIDNTQVVPFTTNSESSGSNCVKNAEKLKEFTNKSLVINKNASVDDDYDSKIEEFHIQTESEDTIIEVKSEEEEIKIEEVCETIEVDKSETVGLPEIDCYISDSEVVETESRISQERLEQELKDSSNESCRTRDFSNDELNSTDHRQEIAEIVYVDN